MPGVCSSSEGSATASLLFTIMKIIFDGLIAYRMIRGHLIRTSAKDSNFKPTSASVPLFGFVQIFKTTPPGRSGIQKNILYNPPEHKATRV